MRITAAVYYRALCAANLQRITIRIMTTNEYRTANTHWNSSQFTRH